PAASRHACAFVGASGGPDGGPFLSGRFAVAARVLFALGGLGVVVAVHARHHGDLVAFTQAHDAHAAAVAALHVDVRRMDADQDTVGADEDQVVAFIHDLDARHAAFGVEIGRAS